jgi:ribosomal protein L37AE/L43A
MNPVTETRDCPKCRADMLMQKAIGDSEKWKCTGCNAVFFFDPLADEVESGQLFMPAVQRAVEDFRPSAADCIGKRCMEIR